MFCEKCGTPLSGSENFCPVCGRQIAEHQPQRIEPMPGYKPMAGTQTVPALFQPLTPAAVRPSPQFADPSQMYHGPIMSNLGSKPFNVSGANLAQWSQLNAECQDEDHYERWINNLNGIHPMVKNVLQGLMKATVTAGKVIFRIGKVILNLLMKLLTGFPMTIAGAIVGFILGLIFSSIPLIGWLLGGLIVPLLTFMGGFLGFMADMQNHIASAQISANIRSKVAQDFTDAGLFF